MPTNTALVAITRGVLAGAVGTAAMTLTQKLEMALTGREGSQVPGLVGAHVTPGIDPAEPAEVEQLNDPVHWVHGVTMGALRGALDVTGLRGLTATAAHFALVWTGDVALYRALGIAEAPWHWEADELATDLLHKGVYALTTGAVYDALAEVRADRA